MWFTAMLFGYMPSAYEDSVKIKLVKVEIINYLIFKLFCSDNERLWLLSCTPGPAADTASRHQEHTTLVKRTLGVSRSSSASSTPPERHRHNKQQKTHKARKDLCCFCSIASTCSLRNCPCTKAGRPCPCCSPGVSNRCTNTVAAHNRAICIENTRQTTSIAACFWQHIVRPLDPLIPLHNVPTPPAADDDKIGLMEVNQNNPSGNAAELDNAQANFYDALTAFWLSMILPRTMTMMTHHPMLLASWLMGAMQWR